MFTWFDGHIVLALIVAQIFSTWAIGYINYRLSLAHRRRGANR